MTATLNPLLCGSTRGARPQSSDDSILSCSSRVAGYKVIGFRYDVFSAQRSKLAIQDLVLYPDFGVSRTAQAVGASEQSSLWPAGAKGLIRV